MLNKRNLLIQNKNLKLNFMTFSTPLFFNSDWFQTSLRYRFIKLVNNLISIHKFSVSHYLNCPVIIKSVRRSKTFHLAENC